MGKIATYRVQLKTGLTHRAGSNELLIPYAGGDVQSDFDPTEGKNLLLVNGGRLALFDDSDTFSVAFEAAQIRVTWNSEQYRVGDIDDLLFVFNLFAAGTYGIQNDEFVIQGAAPHLLLRDTTTNAYDFRLRVDGNICRLQVNKAPDGSAAVWTDVHVWDASTGGSSGAGVFDVKLYGAVGDGVADDTTAFQNALTAASAAVTGTQTRSVETVYVPEGHYKLTSQIQVPSKVRLHCDGVLFNHLANLYTPVVWVRAGGHLGDLNIYGNGGAGVKLGETSTYCDITFDRLRLWNIGEAYDGVAGPQRGIHITGYNVEGDAVQVDGGNLGLDIEAGSDVRINELLLFTGSTGFRITSGSEHIQLGRLMVDSPNWIAGQIDSSKDIAITDLSVFINDSQVTNAGDALGSGYGIKIGEYSSGSLVEGLNITLRSSNTRGVALYLGYVANSEIRVNLTNYTLLTGNSYATTTGIQYGTGVASSLVVRGVINGIATPISGTVAGVLDIVKDGKHYLAGGANAEFVVPVLLPADPSTALQAATKQYADARETAANVQAKKYAIIFG